MEKTIPLQGTPDVLLETGIDLSGDGSRVIYHHGGELFVVNADGSGTRTLLELRNGAIFSARISGNGRLVCFYQSGGADRALGGDRWEPMPQGVYCIDVASGSLSRICDRDALARLFACRPDEVGLHFRTEAPEYGLDVSFDGRRVVFGMFAKGNHHLVGWEAGRGLATIASWPSNYYNSLLLAVALSADGKTVAYRLDGPRELGVVSFDGSGRKALQTNNGELWPWHEHRISITADGSRVYHCGFHYDVASGQLFELIRSASGGIIGHSEYYIGTMDAAGRRFSYWTRGDVMPTMQVGVVELNTPLDQLRGAPRISRIRMRPPLIDRAKEGAATQYPLMEATIASPTPLVARVSAILLVNGAWDRDGGSTWLRDDASARVGGDPNSEDRQGGDGIYTSRSLYAQPGAALGARTLRIDAQTTGADNMRHGEVVELGYPEVVDGWPEDAPGTEVEVVAPAPPTDDGLLGPSVDDGGGPVGPPTPVDPIDLTGFWVDDLGAPYTIRQIELMVYWSSDARPRRINVFDGALEGALLRGQWVDLPGGAQDDGIGTLTLRVESNDRMVRTDASIPYAGTVWTRVGSLPGPGSNTGPTDQPNPPRPQLQPWETPEGQAAFEEWIAEAMRRVNAYDGDKDYNDVKPYQINRYGILEHRKLKSAFAPDNFRDYGYNRYWYMWDYWVPGPGGWKWPEWNAAGVPPLRDFVMARLQRR